MRKPDVVSTQTNTLFRGEQAEWRAAIHPAYDALRPKHNSWGTTAKFRLKCRSASCCASVRDMWKWVQRFPRGWGRGRFSSWQRLCPCQGAASAGSKRTDTQLRKGNGNSESALILCLVTNSSSPCHLITSISFTDANCLSLVLSSCNLFPLVKSISTLLGANLPFPSST